MQLKQLTQFDNYFGQKVDLSFLGSDKKIILDDETENSLGEGASLRSLKTGKIVKVGEELKASGTSGQANIYKSEDPNYVIKLYKRESRTEYTEKKLLKMIEFENTNPNICWPIDILETEEGVFVGFTMPLVSGKDLYSLTTNPKRVMRKYTNFNRKIQVDMIIEMLNLFKFLHDMNIIIGDVKLQNIMFNEKDYHITLIDIDSVQISQFPCDSSTPGYDAPEVILRRGKEKYEEKLPNGEYAFNQYYHDFYRTMQMEQYSIAVLFYKFLMNGNAPYDYRDLGKYNDDDSGETYNDNELCIKAQFPYGLTYEETENTVQEPEIWSHFPSFLKKAFVSVFSGRERYSDDKWLKIFNRYKQIIESEQLKNFDDEYLVSFPNDEIDYKKLIISVFESIENKGFVMWQAVGRIIKKTNNSNLLKRLLEISKALSSVPEYIVDDKYKFEVVYNIGVLKKVRYTEVF